jgi:hypothetical protein
MNAAIERKAERGTSGKQSCPPAIWDDSPKEQMIRAVKSLAFDILRALDESMPPEALERSIEGAYGGGRSSVCSCGAHLSYAQILRWRLSLTTNA